MKNIKTLLIILQLITVVKLSAQDFQKIYGGPNDDRCHKAILANDGNLILVGSTKSFGEGNEDGLIIKIDTATTNVLWSKTYGGSGIDHFQNIIELVNGDLMVLGWSNSETAGGTNMTLLRLDSLGNIMWSRQYGGNLNERGYTIIRDDDGNFLLGGWTESFGSGRWDIYIIKVNPLGDMIWSKTYGNTGNEWINDGGITQDENGDYVVSAVWTQNAGIPFHNGLIMYINKGGEVLSSNIYGGSGNDGQGYMFLTGDEILTFGLSWSWNGPNHEIWFNSINKTNKNITSSKTIGLPSENIRISSALRTTDNNYLLTSYEFTNSQSGNSHIILTDDDGNILESYLFEGDYVDRLHSSLYANGSFWGFGYSNSNDGNDDDIYVTKVKIGNQTDCIKPLQLSENTVSALSENANVLVSTVTNESGIEFSLSNPNLNEDILCVSAPMADFTFSSNLICVDDCVSLIDMSSENVSSWTWIYNGEEINSSQQPDEICFDTEGEHAITLIVSNGLYSDTTIQTITVNSCPEINIGGLNTLCPGENFQFSVSNYIPISDHSLYIIVSDIEGEILDLNLGNTFSFSSNNCSDFQVHSYIHDNESNGLFPMIGGNINSIGDEVRCCQLVSETFSFADILPPTFSYVQTNPNYPSENGPFTQIFCVEDIPSLQAAEYLDNCLGAGTVSGIEENLSDPCTGGNYIRTWTISDSCNNTPSRYNGVM